MKYKFSVNYIKILLLLHVLLFVYSMCGIASKSAAQQPFLSTKFILFYGIVLVGLVVYALFWQQIIKKLPITVAYVNKAVTIIWGMFWGVLFFNEEITWNKWLGILVIIAGIYLVISEEESK